MLAQTSFPGNIWPSSGRFSPFIAFLALETSFWAA